MGQAAGTTPLQGLQLAKLQIGVDYRIARAVAINPVVGADLSTFLGESAARTSSSQTIDSPKVNTFVFAGLLGRFDIPTSSTKAVAVSE